MPMYEVLSEQMWHSTECRMYAKGEMVELPEGTTGKSVRLLTPKEIERARRAVQAAPQPAAETGEAQRTYFGGLPTDHPDLQQFAAPASGQEVV
jgi:hypothetical protein